MALVTLEAIGPRGEELAMAAADKLGIVAGWDSEFDCATFDADDDEETLQASIFDTLALIDPDWASHLRVAE